MGEQLAWELTKTSHACLYPLSKYLSASQDETLEPSPRDQSTENSNESDASCLELGRAGLTQCLASLQSLG